MWKKNIYSQVDNTESASIIYILEILNHTESILNTIATIGYVAAGSGDMSFTSTPKNTVNGLTQG